MSEHDALELVFERNNFYRRQYFLALAAFALSLVVIAALVVALMAQFDYLVKIPSKPLYFATDKVSRLIDIIPATEPNMSMKDLVSWTVDAVQKSNTYDYVNYHSQLQEAQQYFTQYGWSKYMAALAASNNLLALKQRKMIVTAQVVEDPKLIVQGMLGGAYAWKFEMPVLMTYWLPPYDEKSKFTNALKVTITVQRQPVLQSYRGLGVVQMIASAASSDSVVSNISDTPTE